MNFLNQNLVAENSVNLACLPNFRGGTVLESLHDSCIFSNHCMQLPFPHNFWILYSGANDHICYDPSLFFKLIPIAKPFHITSPIGNTVTVSHWHS